jgi:riboflavin kinase
VLELKGRIVSGAGEGAYYMCQEGYRNQFERELGFTPYKGTMDVKLDEAFLDRGEMLQNLPGKKIKGFKTQERTFGPVKCFEAKLRDTRVAVILPARTHHTEVVELVAPVNLRRKLKLSDGDVVSIEVMI